MNNRFRGATLLALLSTLVLAAPAQAKFPPLTVEIEPLEPVAGEPFTVTVRLWDDSAHTEPATGMPEFEGLDDLLVFAPGDGMEGVARVRVLLDSAGASVLRGEVTLPEAGTWTLSAFPFAASSDDLPAGYPQPMTVEVRDPSALPAGAAAGAAVLLVAIAIGVVLSRRSRAIVRRQRRVTSPAESTPLATS